MKEVVFLGRGGQGAFTAAKILGAAFLEEDARFKALAFPAFGPERRGAPVKAFTKYSLKTLPDRSQPLLADYLVILDESLYQPTFLKQVKKGGLVLINAPVIFNQAQEGRRLIRFDATELALSILKRDIVNTAMLGALTALVDNLSSAAVLSALAKTMDKRLVARNAELIRIVYQMFKEGDWQNEQT